MLREAYGIKRLVIRTGRTDLRYGIDRLCSIVRTECGFNPREEGVLYIFCGTRNDRLKALVFEGDGFVLLTKRLLKGMEFKWPRSQTQALEIPAADGRVDLAAALTCRGRLLHGADKACAVVGAKDHLRADLRALLRAELGVAAGDGHHGPGILIPQAADGLAGLAPGLGRDGAGVDDDRIGELAWRGALMSVGAEHGLHGLRLVLVDLAAESGYNVLHKKLRF